MKRKIKKRLLITLLVLILLVILLPLLSFFMPEGMSASETKDFFKSRQVKYKDTLLKSGECNIRFVCTGNDTMPLLFFIHGSPGSWDAFKDYLADSGLLTKAFMVSVDRPGYGGSGVKGEATLEGQVNCLESVLRLRKNNKPITLVGHSYGGPVAVKFAIRYPELIKQVVLMAPTICPAAEEKMKWKHHLQNMGQWWLWRWSISRDLKNSLVEMQPLLSELKQMEKEYGNIKIPILEIHGTEDDLAPIENQAYVKKVFVNSKVDTMTLRGENHFIPWTRTEWMIGVIKEKL